MTRIVLLFVCFFSLPLKAQTLNLNNPFFEQSLRRAQLNGEIDSSMSFTLRPLDISQYEVSENVFDLESYSPTVLSFFKGNGKLKILPIDFNII